MEIIKVGQLKLKTWWKNCFACHESFLWKGSKGICPYCLHPNVNVEVED